MYSALFLVAHQIAVCDFPNPGHPYINPIFGVALDLSIKLLMMPEKFFTFLVLTNIFLTTLPPHRHKSPDKVCFL